MLHRRHHCVHWSSGIMRQRIGDSVYTRCGTVCDRRLRVPPSRSRMRAATAQACVACMTKHETRFSTQQRTCAAWRAGARQHPRPTDACQARSPCIAHAATHTRCVVGIGVARHVWEERLEQDAKREHVGRCAVAAARNQHLGSHPLVGASTRRHVGLSSSWQYHVGDLDIVLGREEDVVRLDVAMDDVIGVKVTESVRNHPCHSRASNE